METSNEMVSPNQHPTPWWISAWEFLQISLFALVRPFLTSLGSKKAKAFIASRNDSLFENTLTSLVSKRDPQVPLFWIHVASAGELEIAVPVIRELHLQTQAQIFLTYFSPSAEPFLEKVPHLFGAMTFPLDLTTLHREILERLQISGLFFVRYDLWPSLLYTARSMGCPVFLISGSRATTNRSFAPYFAESLRTYFYRYFEIVFAVSESDSQWFRNKTFVTKAVTCGDPKWARARERANIRNSLSVEKQQLFERLSAQLSFMQMRDPRSIIAFGSPHKGEVDVIPELSNRTKIRFIIAPHEIDSESIEQLTQQLERVSLRVARLTQLSETEIADVILLDCIGLLAESYRLAHLAVVGGGFDGQIHNVLEPAANGACTLFGPQFARAPECRQLLEKKAALSFKNPMAMAEWISRFVQHDVRVRQQADTIRNNANQIFSQLPNTSELIGREVKRYYDKTTHH